MSSAIVVVILVAAGEANAPATSTIAAAASETVGPNASFVVREVAVPSDNDALTLEDDLHASAVVEIVWSGTARTRVMLRLHLARLDRWVQREVTFLPADNPRERSRTVGFALASMLSSESDFRNTLAKAARDSVAESPPKAKPKPEPASNRGPEPKMEPEPKGEPEAPTEREPERRSRPRTPPVTPPEPYAVDLTAVGSTGIGGPAGGLGGAARVEYFVQHTFWLAASLGVRSGSLPNSNGGDDLVVSAMAGGAWRPFFPTSASPFELELAMQAGVLLHDFSYNDTPVTPAKHNTKLIPGGQLMLEGGFRLDASWEVIVGVGAEMAFGITEVQVEDLSSNSPPVSLPFTIPRFRGLGAAGLRLHF